MSLRDIVRSILPPTNRNFEERMASFDNMLREMRNENQMLHESVNELACRIGDLQRRHRYFNGEYLNLCPSKGEKILIAGWYGANNFGDELMLKTILSYVPVERMHQVYVLLWDNESYNRETLDLRCNVIHYPFSVWDLEALADSFDVVVWGGGAILDDEQYDDDPRNFNTGNLFIRLNELMLARNKRVYALGLSANAALEQPRYIQRLSKIIAYASFFSLRDPYSLKTLEQAGVCCANVVLCEDLAFSHPDVFQLADIDTFARGKRLGVVLLSTEDSYSDNLSILMSLVRSNTLQNAGYTISMIPFLDEDHHDETYYRRLINDLPDAGCPIELEQYTASLKESPLLGCSLVVSSKYHASLIADVARIPNISIWSEAHPHYKNKMTYLAETAGVSQTLYSLSEIRNGSTMEDALTGLLDLSTAPSISRDFLKGQSKWLEGVISDLFLVEDR